MGGGGGGCRDGVFGESTCLPPMWPGFDSRTRRRKWTGLCLLLVVVLALRDYSKTNISKFQFDLNYCQALYHENLAQETAQALRVLLTLDKLLHLTFTLLYFTCGSMPSIKNLLNKKFQPN